MNRSDSGYILPMTIVTLTLLAFAALLTGRTFGVLLRASTQERLILEERYAVRNAEKIVDAWMAHRTFSKEITDQKPGYDAWRNPEGAANTQTKTNCPVTGYTTCWRITVSDPYDPHDPLKPPAPKLRGLEAEQHIRDITIEIRSGCYSGIDQCQRTSTITRTYERAVFSQYQLHYDSHDTPPAAIVAARESLRQAETTAEAMISAAEPTLTGDQVQALVETDPTVIEWTNRIDLMDDGVILFADGDKFNGPVRYGGTGGIRYCLNGSDTLLFKRLETRTEPDQSQNLCGTTKPQWCDDPCNTALSEPWPSNSRSIVKGDELELPPWAIPASDARTTLTCDPCDTSDFGPTTGVFYRGGDINLSTVDFTLSPRSVTIISGNNIRITGDIKTTGLNEADGPNVVAFIARENIILDHAPGTQITFSNVALLARNGGIFASNWWQPCPNTLCPNFTLEGSTAMTHLGLYGLVGPPQTGWTKNFSYLTDFWRARPPWWPGYDSYPIPEWEPV